MIGKMKKPIKAFISAIIFVILFTTSNIKVLAEDKTQDSFSVGKQIIQQYYIEDVPESKLNAASDMDNLVKSLNDPYSTYFTETQYNDFVNTINNSFSGIGIQIEETTEGIKVISVFDKTPAKELGITSGDIIVKADDHNLVGLSAEEAVKYIKGKSGTKVKLEIKRDGTTLVFEVERKDIVLPTVEGDILDKHIGYIKITSFGEKTSSEFDNMLLNLNKSTPDCYIIDLRNNGGGYMDVAFDIAGYFIGENVVLKTQTKSGQSTIFKATKQKETIDKPVIFLINQHSASASEILAAAVKDYKKAFFIGEKTYGKGVAQSVFTLPDNSYLKLTTLRFVSPLGNQINKVGITPDMEIKDDPDNNVDSLNAARILLSNINKGTDKIGLAMWKFKGNTYDIALNTAQNQDNLSTYKYMMSNIFEKVSSNIKTNTTQSFSKGEAPTETTLPVVSNPTTSQEQGDVVASRNAAEENTKAAPEKASVNKYYAILFSGIIFICILAGVYLKKRGR